MKRSVQGVWLLAGLAACAGDPPPPVNDDLGIAVPEDWTAQPPDEKVRPDDPAVPVNWWLEFGDERLASLIEIGLTNNQNLRASMARLEAASAAQTIAGAPLLPELDLGLQADRSKRIFLGFPFGGGSAPSSTVTTYGLSLAVRWEVDVWGRLRAADSAALADQQAALEDLRGAQLSLTAQICRAWFAAIETNQQLELASATAEAFAKTHADVLDRFRRGVRPALEVHQAATNLADARASIARRRDLHSRAMRRLDVLIGRYPTGALSIADDLPAKLPEIPVGLPSEILRRRPDLRAAERRVAAAGCRVEAAQAALYPRLALTASGGTQTLELEDLVDTDFRIWSVGANLLEPLFRGGALRAEVRRQQAQRAEAFANYGNTVLTAFAEVEDILNSKSQLVIERDGLVDAARHARYARDLARERWQLGLTDFLSVADGQRRAFLTESARLQVDLQLIQNRIDLLLALGGSFDDASSEETR